ncbi:transcription elongation factor [Gillisia sp. M10.2A]|uniref:Transcription elongation factor n=1 Tax=Gillisia lutea TaxID=2909668 RepID=A0ABS9EE92_9FLAO|nr:transcription elongation factor [Gillisia lutea]MCF4100582.1 transcription elongation factor [Gillisia lutea]
MNTRFLLLDSCKEYVDSRIERITVAVNDLQLALENDTKSSAGDKYETGREMINLEFNKLSAQLQNFRKLKETLHRVENSSNSTTIQLGSVVKTTGANYFISIPAGELTCEDGKYYAIGANSPIAQILLGKAEADNFSFNGKTFIIKEVN